MLRSFCIALTLTAGALGCAVHAAESSLDTAVIEIITGLKGTYNKA